MIALSLLLASLAAVPILKVVFGFGFVIFAHEFGHFLMARYHGVYVEKFAIGFDYPFPLFTWTGKTGTEYVIGPLPVGGYVKMLGQNELPSELDSPRMSRPDSFLSKTVWQRVQIISAGVIANFLSAFVLCYLAFGMGFNSSPPAVGTVGFDSLSAGLRPGDVVREIGGAKIASWEDIFVNYATLEPGSPVDFLVTRDGAERRVTLPVQRNPDEPFNRPDFGRPLDTRVNSVAEPSAAFDAGLLPGDWLVSVDGDPVESWADFTDMIRRRAEKQTTLTVRREVDGAEQTVELGAVPSAKTPDEVPARSLGFLPQEPAVVQFVAPEGPGRRAGLQPGDEVVAVGETRVGSWYELWKTVSWDLPEGAPVPLTVRRDGGERSLSVTPGAAQNWAVGTHALSTLGIAGALPELLVVGAIEPGGPADQAKLRTGDVLRRMTVQVEGTDEEWTVPDPTWDTLLYALNNLSEDRVALELDRGGERVEVEVPAAQAPHDVRIGFLGVGPMIKKEVVQMGWGAAALPALLKPFQILDQFVVGLKAMFIGNMSAKMVSGPVGIIRAMHTFAKEGTGDLMLFLALLSVNLAVVNFLPIPITDGGHFMFLMYEKFKGKRMDEDLYSRFQWAGLVFILLVFVFATFNDVGMILGF